MRQILYLFFVLASSLMAQEATSGFDLRATLSTETVSSSELTEEPRNGSPLVAGFRAMMYPTWRLSKHWSVTGTFQVASRPWFYESLTTQGYGLKGTLLQGTLNYGQSWRNGSLALRAGELSTAFGSFLLRYDDADNPLIDLPMQYGYYYDPISNNPVAGVEADVTQGRFDGRLQIVNSSPINPRSVFAKDQYANFAGGAGYTVRQGFRVGISMSRGPYLYRAFPFFFPGEANPIDLPAHALGVEVDWARGQWYTHGELQTFVFPYRAIPTYRERAGYAEVKRVLHPRWYVAVRTGYIGPESGGGRQNFETAVGFRPGNRQLLKFGYEVEHYSANNTFAKTLAIQYVTTIHPLSVAMK